MASPAAAAAPDACAEVVIESVEAVSEALAGGSKGAGKNLLRARESVDAGHTLHLELVARLQNSKDHNRLLPPQPRFRIAVRSSAKGDSQLLLPVAMRDPCGLLASVVGARREPFPYWRFLISVGITDALRPLRDCIDGYSFALEAEMLEAGGRDYVALRNVRLRDISATEYLHRRTALCVSPAPPAPAWLAELAALPMATNDPAQSAAAAAEATSAAAAASAGPATPGTPAPQLVPQPVCKQEPAQMPPMSASVMQMQMMPQQAPQQEPQQAPQQQFMPPQQFQQMQVPDARFSYGFDSAAFAALSAYDAGTAMAVANGGAGGMRPPMHFPTVDVMQAMGLTLPNPAAGTGIPAADLMDLDFLAAVGADGFEGFLQQ